jgi:hypothetical protein
MPILDSGPLNPEHPRRRRLVRRFIRFVLAVALVLGLSAASTPATAESDIHSPNTKHIGYSGFPGTTNSDLAFWGHYMIAGTYIGPRILDISNPADPRQLSFTKCNGGQGDISVWKNFIFESVDSDQTKPTCDSSSVSGGLPPGFEGIRIFDWSNPAKPKYVTAVPTDCGSHTNTIVPDEAHGVVYLYVESYPLTGQDDGCNFHNYDSVVKVPLANPKKASVSTFDTSPSAGCHDVTVYLPLKIAAASCLSEGQIWDISNPGQPKVIQHLYNPAISIWHTAGFSNDGKTVMFDDENQSYQACFGPGQPYGAIWFYTMDGKTASSQPAGYFSLPRAVSGDPQTECTAHNFNVVPGIKHDILVSAFYSGGFTVVDFTDPANPKEIGYYQIKGKVPADEWSTYWYNGLIYSNDINRGVDVFSFSSPLVKGATTLPHLNPQTQE